MQNGTEKPTEENARVLEECCIHEDLIFRLREENHQLKAEVSDLRDRLNRLNEAYKDVAFKVDHDGLTGVFTRQAAVSRIEKTMAASNGPFILAFIDIDNFKCINDSLGHIAGDNVLVALAQFLEGKAQGHGVVGRFGGDEFLFFLDMEEEIRLNPSLRHHMPKPNETLKIEGELFEFADGIRTQALEAIELDHENGACSPSVSIGIVFFRAHGSVDELIKMADDAIYQSKAKGKNAVTLVEGILST